MPGSLALVWSSNPCLVLKPKSCQTISVRSISVSAPIACLVHYPVSSLVHSLYLVQLAMSDPNIHVWSNNLYLVL